MIFSLIESLLESIEKVLSDGRISWGAVITALLFFNKINKYKEFRARDKRVELRQLRIESKVDDLMQHAGVESSWSLRESGLNQEDRPKLKRLYSLLQAVIIRRRNIFMGKLLSRKFWLTILAALIPVINEEFNIHLDVTTMGLMMTAVMAGVAALAHVDAKKVLAGLVHSKANAKEVEVAFKSFQEAIPFITEVRDNVNQFIIDARKNDGSQSYHLAMKAFAEIDPILKAYKIPEPIATVEENKVDEQVSA